MAVSNVVNVGESRSVAPLNTWVLISNFKLKYNLLRRPDGTFDRILDEFLDRKVLANTTPVDSVYSFDVIINRSTNLLSRIYRPASDNTTYPGVIDIKQAPTSTVTPIIVFFHGGSFTHSSANSAIYDTLCRRLVGLCKAVVVSVNYRRSPEHRYPCAYDDGWAALKWVNSQYWLRSGKDSKAHVFLAGDSSGGNIVHHVAMRAVELGIKVLGNILLNPMFGGEKRTESERRLDGKYFVTIQDRDWYWKAYLPDGADRDHPACNPFGPNGVKLDGLRYPKSLVIVAGLDLVQDWQLAYVDGLKRAGQDVKLIYLEQATIGFYLLPNTHHYYSVMEEIKNFVENESGVSNFIPVLFGDNQTCSELQTIQQRFGGTLYSNGLGNFDASTSCELFVSRQTATSELLLDVAWLLKEPRLDNDFSSVQIHRFTCLLSFLIQANSFAVLARVLQSLKILMDGGELYDTVNRSNVADLRLFRKFMDQAREILHQRLQNSVRSTVPSENATQVIIFPESSVECEILYTLPSANHGLEMRNEDALKPTAISAFQESDLHAPLINKHIIMNVNQCPRVMKGLEWPQRTCGSLLSSTVKRTRLTLLLMTALAMCFGICVTLVHPHELSRFAVSIRRCLFGASKQ